MATLSVRRPPERSLTQRLDALARANEVRLAQAQLRRRIATGDVSLIDILDSPDEFDYASGIKVADLLLARRQWGPVKVSKLLAKAHVSHAKRLGQLTPGVRRKLGYVVSDELARLDQRIVTAA